MTQNKTMTPGNILVVDDVSMVRLSLRRILEKAAANRILLADLSPDEHARLLKAAGDVLGLIDQLPQAGSRFGLAALATQP